MCRRRSIGATVMLRRLRESDDEILFIIAPTIGRIYYGVRRQLRDMATVSSGRARRK